MKSLSVYWSPQAEESYLNILSNILERWSIKEANDFQSKVEGLIEKLIILKHICPASEKHENLRRCVVTRLTSMVYRINDETIEIIAFFDNRSNHKY